MTQKILWFKGLPGSGKSTIAKSWVNEKPTERVRVNKDDLRSLLHQGKFSKGNENQVLAIQNEIIIDSLNRGKSLAIDNTHLIDKHLNNLKELLKKNNYNDVTIEVVDLTNVEPEECIERDLKRANSVGSTVIWRMYWEQVASIKTIEQDVNKEDAIIVDVDGTLSQMEERHPYQWEKVKTDSVRSHIRLLSNLYARQGYKVIILTGRDGVAFKDTVEWLEFNEVIFDQIFIRPEGDCRKDFIVKKEIYDNSIAPFYNVHLVVDDRPQVIREWRRLGLPVINANPCDREF